MPFAPAEVENTGALGKSEFVLPVLFTPRCCSFGICSEAEPDKQKSRCAAGLAMPLILPVLRLAIQQKRFFVKAYAVAVANNHVEGGV